MSKSKTKKPLNLLRSPLLAERVPLIFSIPRALPLEQAAAIIKVLYPLLFTDGIWIGMAKCTLWVTFTCRMSPYSSNWGHSEMSARRMPEQGNRSISREKSAKVDFRIESIC